jgi:HK97 family phage major capsid protein
MADPTEIVEKREAFSAKQDKIRQVMDAAGQDLDFSRKPCLELLGATDGDDASLKWRALNQEAEAAGRDLRKTEDRLAAKRFQQREEERVRPVDDIPHPGYDENGRRLSWDEQYVASKEFKDAVAAKHRHSVPFVAEGVSVKTLFETAAGFAVENRRSGLVVDKATRPIQVVDMIPAFQIAQAAFVYMQETTRTPGAAERAEGTAYPESTFVFAPATSPVQKIADSIPVTDEQMEDVDTVRSLLTQRLSFGIRQRLDQQILVGNGTSPNLRGILNVSGIQTQALGADDRIAAFMKALTLIRFTGRASPSGAVFHPTDWQSVILTKTSAGEYLFGNPFMGAGPSSLFGIQVALSDALTQGTAIVGDFNTFSRLDERRGVEVQTGYVGTQFTDGKLTLRADMRAAFTITRPAAFATITGL